MHSSLRDDNLVIRTQGSQRNEILELIPSSKLRGDLPPALVDGHVHWLNLTTKIIEIRPIKQLWEQSSENWRIDCASGQYGVYRGCETLLDIRSPTWAMVSECFKCLNIVDERRRRWRLSDDDDLQDQSRNLLVTTSPIGSVQSASTQRLSVTLPRYGLSFFVNEREELESRDFKDMVYDEDQCVGALFGLENLLVLRPKTHIAGALVPEALIPRRVLIPNGFPKSHGDHHYQVRIEINTSPFARHAEPLYHTYDVDTELGCLIGNYTLMSTRYLAYLHAMTSCHRPDPLTGKMGGQAALCLLQSAGCRSIMKLKAFEDCSVWTLNQYPQVIAAYKDILKGYYWNHHSYLHGETSAPEKHAALRAAYIFTSNAAGSTFPEENGEIEYTTKSLPAEPGLATLPHPISSFNQCLPRQIALDHLLCNCPAPELPARSALLRDTHNTSSDNSHLLDQLLFSLRADSSFQREYLTHLDTSAQSVRVVSETTHKMADENLIEALQRYYVQCRVNYLGALDIVKKSLGRDPHETAIDRFGQWPPITGDVLLRYLASASPIDIPAHWKKCLISLALLLLELQRSRRLLRYALDGLGEEFSKELENEGCDGWNADEYPDWLLIQVAYFCRNTRAY